MEEELKTIPKEYFAENFKLNKNVFSVTSSETAVALNDNLSKYLEIIECNLVANIQNNFDFFTDAFTNFDGMKADLQHIKEKAHLVKTSNGRLK